MGIAFHPNPTLAKSPAHLLCVAGLFNSCLIRCSKAAAFSPALAYLLPKAASCASLAYSATTQVANLTTWSATKRAITTTTSNSLATTNLNSEYSSGMVTTPPERGISKVLLCPSARRELCSSEL